MGLCNTSGQATVHTNQPIIKRVIQCVMLLLYVHRPWNIFPHRSQFKTSVRHIQMSLLSSYDVIWSKHNATAVSAVVCSWRRWHGCDKSIRWLTGVEAHLHHGSPGQTYSDTREDADADPDPCQTSGARLTFYVLIASCCGQKAHWRSRHYSISPCCLSRAYLCFLSGFVLPHINHNLILSHVWKWLFLLLLL